MSESLKTATFFRENVLVKTAWNAGCGYHIRFSMQKMIYDRDEDEVRKLVAQYKLKVTKSNSYVTFTKD